MKKTTTLLTATICPVKGCDEPGGWMFRERCNYHEALHLARELTPKRLDDLLSEMADVVPLTEAEKNERRLLGRLSFVKSQADALSRAEAQARADGATDAQIEGARQSGG